MWVTSVFTWANERVARRWWCGIWWHEAIRASGMHALHVNEATTTWTKWRQHRHGKSDSFSGAREKNIARFFGSGSSSPHVPFYHGMRLFWSSTPLYNSFEETNSSKNPSIPFSHIPFLLFTHRSSRGVFLEYYNCIHEMRNEIIRHMYGTWLEWICDIEIILNRYELLIWCVTLLLFYCVLAKSWTHPCIVVVFRYSLMLDDLHGWDIAQVDIALFSSFLRLAITYSLL